MSNATITLVGGDYQVAGSTQVSVVVAMDLSGGVGDEGELIVAFPLAATVSLVHGAVTQPVVFTVPQPDPSPVFTSRLVGITHTDAAGIRTVTFSISDVSVNPSTNDVWTVKLTGLPVAAGVTTVTPSLHVIGLTVEADPIVDCTTPVGPFSAGQPIPLVGKARRNTMPLPTTTAASYNPPPSLLVWSQTSLPTTSLTAGATTAASVGAPAAPGFTTTATATAPSVSTMLTYLFTATFGEFVNTCPVSVQTQAVNHRWMIALDRSATMAGAKFGEAAVAANLWADLVSAFRLPAFAQDSIGVLTFDDSAIGFRTAGPAPSVQVRWPGAAMAPLRAVTDASMDGLKVGGAAVLGAPTGQTPLGDGLAASLDAMVTASAGAAGDQYDLVVFSDGMENTGTIKVDLSSTITGASNATGFDTARNQDGRSIFKFEPALDDNIRVYPVGPISPAPVNTVPLNVLGAYGRGTFPMPIGVQDVLSTAFGSALLDRLDASSLDVMADDTQLESSDPAFATDKQVYLQVPAGDDKLVVAVLCSNTPPRNKTLHLLWRLQAGGGFDPVPVAALQSVARDSYLFAVVDLAQVSTAATEWRVSVTKKVGTVTTNEDVPPDSVLAGRDLNVRSEITFDRDSYFNDEPIVIRGSVFAGGQAVKNARITVEVEGPALSAGELLAANAKVAEPPVPTQPGAVVGPPDTRDGALLRVLASRKATTLPTVQYKSVFIDGTNDLQPDPAGEGRYGNAFTKNGREGRYEFRFRIKGKTDEGSAFSDVYRASREVKIRADDISSPVSVDTLDARAPKGLRAARVTVTPRDAMGQRLGPYRSSEVEFITSSGTFIGDVESGYDGSYSQSLLYAAVHRPVVTARVQGRTFTPILVAPGFVGWLTGLVRRASAWLVRYARRG